MFVIKKTVELGINELFLERDGWQFEKEQEIKILQLQKYNFYFLKFYKQLHMSKFYCLSDLCFRIFAVTKV